MKTIYEEILGDVRRVIKETCAHRCMDDVRDREEVAVAIAAAIFRMPYMARDAYVYLDGSDEHTIRNALEIALAETREANTSHKQAVKRAGELKEALRTLVRGVEAMCAPGELDEELEVAHKALLGGG